MKLGVKDKYYQRIFRGDKNVEFRDAHISFVNEKTGKTLVKKVLGLRFIAYEALPDELIKTDMFDGGKVIVFELSSRCSGCAHDLHNIRDSVCGIVLPDGDSCFCKGEES